MYNTNLVFDRSGNLVAKYWKQNLFFEPVFDVPAEPVFTSFTSDFGVSFGTFTCFDVIWEQSVQLLAKAGNTNMTTIQFCSNFEHVSVPECDRHLVPHILGGRTSILSGPRGSNGLCCTQRSQLPCQWTSCTRKNGYCWNFPNI